MTRRTDALDVLLNIALNSVDDEIRLKAAGTLLSYDYGENSPKDTDAPIPQEAS